MLFTLCFLKALSVALPLSGENIHCQYFNKKDTHILFGKNDLNVPSLGSWFAVSTILYSTSIISLFLSDLLSLFYPSLVHSLASRYNCELKRYYVICLYRIPADVTFRST